MSSKMVPRGKLSITGRTSIIWRGHLEVNNDRGYISGMIETS